MIYFGDVAKIDFDTILYLHADMYLTHYLLPRQDYSSEKAVEKEWWRRIWKYQVIVYLELDTWIVIFMLNIYLKYHFGKK